MSLFNFKKNSQTNTNTSQEGCIPSKISTVADMSSMLCYIDNYSDIISHQILNAQLQVIQCFQTPELVDSAVDTILFDLQKALQNSQTNEEKTLVKEQFAFIIQNLVIIKK